MPTNLLILPLLGGFWFVHFCHYFRFRSQRLDGYRLLIESGLAGVCLIAFARCGVLFLKIFPLGASFQASWEIFAPMPYSGTAAGSLILGMIAPFAVNLLIIGGKERARDLAVKRHGHDLLRLLNEALERRMLVSFTLENRKWYVGYVTRAPNLDPQESYVSLLPIVSGYRQTDTLEVHVTTEYMPLYMEGVDRNDFLITVPLSGIKMASLFREEIYAAFFAPREEAEFADQDAAGGSQ